MNGFIQLGYYFAKGIIGGFKFPVGVSFDVTNKCNLRCRHCYFFQQNHQQELSDDEFLKNIKEIRQKHPSIIHASWVGGEPLLRKNVVKERMKFFPFNMVVTNGSFELPSWNNCVFNISIDGTKEYYEKIRGVGNYDRAKKNANRNDIHVNIACVLNNENYHCIDDLIKEWKETKIKGINFDFYTPIAGIEDDLWLSWEKRDEIVLKLIELKKKYGNFLLNSKPILELMLSKNSKRTTPNCLVPKAVICLDPMGNRKLPCVIGNKADCARCGCIVAFSIHSIFTKKQIASFLTTKKLFS